MAVKLEYINLIVPNATIGAVFVNEGGFEFYRRSYGVFRELVWYDEHICRVDGAMNWIDMEGIVDFWKERGLVGLVDSSTGKHWKDFCVATSFHGPTYRCDWLDFDAVNNVVSMRGRPTGQVVGKVADAAVAESASDTVWCKQCGGLVTQEAMSALGEAQFGGYNPVSIQHAEPWSEPRIAAFLRSYICKRCDKVPAATEHSIGRQRSK
jgi:hypothetical protein